MDITNDLAALSAELIRSVKDLRECQLLASVVRLKHFCVANLTLCLVLLNDVELLSFNHVSLGYEDHEVLTLATQLFVVNLARLMFGLDFNKFPLHHLQLLFKTFNYFA